MPTAKRPASANHRDRQIARRSDSRGLPRGSTAGVLRHRHHHHSLHADLHAAARGRQIVQADGLDGGVRSSRRHDLLDPGRAGSEQLAVQQGSQGMAQPGHGFSDQTIPQAQCGGPSNIAGSPSALDWRAFVVAMYLTFSGIIGAEFLPHLDEGAIWARGALVEQHKSHGRGALHYSVPAHFRFVSRSHHGRVGSRCARRRNRHGRIRQYRIFRGLEAQRAMAACFSSGQRRADCCDESRGLEISGSFLEFLPAH